ncbi:hypothetical protein CGZ93_14155 [Enemella dayhoffiae]|uniref:HTH tetR-type domain-containing protein n=1 Tax=Enemella dayhoffiae TaxID=2016507 RepID=A0A255GY78_9ACTN|nr:TetR/AcrR family transcriptional regulator [Enemella dayhoffiae]OYO18574.1 hypothetical protein CGZ93_14155 [Enemella dayhoffiae]
MIVQPEATLSPRRAETRRRLMTAAIEVFADKGVNGASVEEICEQAGFTRGAFYSNFDSKDELCAALLRDLCQQHLAAAETAIAQVLDTGEQPLDELIDSAVDTFVAIQPTDRNIQLLQLELRLHAARNAEFAVMFNELDAEMSELFGSLIELGLRRRGVHLSLPARQAIDLLHAVHEAGNFDQLLGRTTPGAGTSDLKALLRNLVRPVQD